jgi:hypothetical protein
MMPRTRHFVWVGYDLDLFSTSRERFQRRSHDVEEMSLDQL